MNGDTWRCPKCAKTIVEADCEYTEALCSRTGACRNTKGHGTPMEVERRHQ